MDPNNIPSELFNEKEVEKLAKLFASIINNNIEKSVNIIRGKVEQSETTVKIAKKSIKEFTQTKEYKTSLVRFVQKSDQVSIDRLKFFSNKKIKISKSSINNDLRLAIKEYMDTMNDFGLNTRFNQPIRKLIYESIRGGKSLREIRKSMKNLIRGKKKKKGGQDGLFKKYAKQNAQTAATAYSSIINQEIINKYQSRVKGLTQVGTLIGTSSPQCIKFAKLGKSLKLETIEKEIMPIAVKNGFQGTLSDILKIPSILMHPGCRHEYIPELTDKFLK